MSRPSTLLFTAAVGGAVLSSAQALAQGFVPYLSNQPQDTMPTGPSFPPIFKGVGIPSPYRYGLRPTNAADAQKAGKVDNFFSTTPYSSLTPKQQRAYQFWIGAISFGLNSPNRGLKLEWDRYLADPDGYVGLSSATAPGQ
jgi:hypothetical protein